MNMKDEKNETYNNIINGLKDLADKCKDFPVAVSGINNIIIAVDLMYKNGSDITDICDYVKTSLDNIKYLINGNGTIIGDGHNSPIITNPAGGSSSNNPTGNKKPNPSGDRTKNRNDVNNPYGFGYGEVDEEELLQAYIEADLPVFLHGLSGCGKSARVKHIDPECTIIYMASAKPETLAGKSAVINGEVKDIPPEWYVKLCKKCEAEPDKNHLLFFDEITNAPPSLQGLAYNIVLDKEINGKWKLPNNCRVVAAGNDMDESLAANPIPEPLFRRFSHIYIDSSVRRWVVWASENGIHPAIISFIVSNKLEDNPVFRTKCDGKNPCVDPRKWEMASKLLKQSNNPNTLIGILGENITKQFTKFVQNEVVTLDQVINGTANIEDGILTPDKCWRIVCSMCAADISNIGKAYAFLKKHCLKEQVELFKQIWTFNGKNQERVDAILEIEAKEKLGIEYSINMRRVA